MSTNSLDQQNTKNDSDNTIVFLLDKDTYEKLYFKNVDEWHTSDQPTWFEHG